MHEMFLDEDKPGQKELFNVLKAYSILNPKVGVPNAEVEYDRKRPNEIDICSVSTGGLLSGSGTNSSLSTNAYAC